MEVPDAKISANFISLADGMGTLIGLRDSTESSTKEELKSAFEKLQKVGSEHDDCFADVKVSPLTAALIISSQGLVKLVSKIDFVLHVCIDYSSFTPEEIASELGYNVTNLDELKNAFTGMTGDGYPEGSFSAANGRIFKQYRQDTGSWASNGYSQGTIASSGCGPTSVAILASGLVDPGITPAKTAADMGGAGNGGTNAEKLKNEMNSLGMPATIKYSPTNSDILNALDNGQVMLVSVEGATIFTGNSHLMTVVDKNSEGKVYVINPNSEGPTSSKSGWYDPSELTKASQYIITTPSKKAGG